MSELPKIGSLVLFLDSKLNKSPDETGFNQIGIVINDSEILCKRGNSITRLSKIKSANNKYDVYAPESEKLTTNVIKYFSKNIISSQIFDLGIAALSNKAPIELFDHPVIMPDFKKLPCIDFEEKWSVIEANAKPGDMFFTYDKKSFISKFIAKLDNGSWSHVGMYVGNGYICEAITSGVTKRFITEYKNKNIRVGIYRHKDMSHEAAQNIKNRCEAKLGGAYNWWGVLKLGIKMVFRIKSQIPSPNGLILGGQLYLVEYA